MIIPKFPSDFIKRDNSDTPEVRALEAQMWKAVFYAGVESYYGHHWILKDEDTGKTLISVIGGGLGHYGDGETTFEMWDYREDDPQGHLTAEEINEHLATNPFLP